MTFSTFALVSLDLQEPIQLSWTAYAAAVFGTLLGLGLVFWIWVDVHLARTGQETISEYFLSLEWDGILGRTAIACIVGVFSVIWCSLGGHFWYFRNDTNTTWLIAYFSWCFFGMIGFVVGHTYFFQEKP